MKPDFNKITSAAGDFLVKAGTRIKELDMGVALTKAQDIAKDLDLEEKKAKIADLLDDPKAEGFKSAMRTVKDFTGFIPYYAQSIPSMVKGALGINDIKSGEYSSENQEQ